MNCKQFQALWTEWPGKELSDEQTGTMAGHYKNCPGCQRYVRQMTTLLDQLKRFPAGRPPAGLSQKLFAHARARAKSQSDGSKRPYAIAAALLIGFVAGALVWPVLDTPDKTLRVAETRPLRTVSLTLDSVQEVHVAINAPREISNATLTLELPAGVEIAGYPGQRQLRWQTGLKAGRNNLTLPLRAYETVTDAVLKTRVEYDGRQKELNVILNAPESHAKTPMKTRNGSTTLALFAVPVSHPQNPLIYLINA